MVKGLNQVTANLTTAPFNKSIQQYIKDKRMKRKRESRRQAQQEKQLVWIKNIFNTL